MAISTTIKRKFLDQKLEELNEKGFTYEYKGTNHFWMKRLVRQSYPCDFVYVCGQRVVRLVATGYSVIDTPTRDGVPTVVPTARCYAIRLTSKEERVRCVHRLKDALRATFGGRVFGWDDLSSFCARLDYVDNELLRHLLDKMRDNGELEIVAKGFLLIRGRQTFITSFAGMEEITKTSSGCVVRGKARGGAG